MNKIHQKIELVANLLIIVVAVMLVGVLAQRYLFRTPAAADQSPRVQPTVGAKVNLPDADWSRRPKTLILALQKGCHFCSESAPFYRRLRESAQNKNVRLLAVLPGTPEESTAYLNDIGIPDVEVRRSPLDTLQVSGTPTLILTNDKGEVMRFWVGKLTPEKEAEVLAQLTT
ncbi:MAG: hypothetical protein JOZ96_11995 [Acidobacteria bacterium]|nr:hypothetical protein [Acidobacteriota bacterium]